MKKKKFLRSLWIVLILAGAGGWFEASSRAAPLRALVPKKDLPKEWTLIQGPQPYNKKTLFERINGQAELFFQYGFQGSVFAVYQHKEEIQNQIEVDIYDMGSTVQAFGIFSRFRNEERPGGFGLDSYLDDHSAFFYKGRYFVLLYSSESSLDALTKFSRLIESKISDRTVSPKEITFFPKDGLKPASIQYFPQGLLGKKFLQKGFRGIYTTGEKESQLFLSLFQDSQKAAHALKLFQEDLLKKGNISTEKVVPFSPRTFKGEDPYQGKVIVLQKKVYLLGEVGFEQEEGAMARLKKLLEKIE